MVLLCRLQKNRRRLCTLSWRVVPRADTITLRGESTPFSSCGGRYHQRRGSDYFSRGARFATNPYLGNSTDQTPLLRTLNVRGTIPVDLNSILCKFISFALLPWIGGNEREWCTMK